MGGERYLHDPSMLSAGSCIDRGREREYDGFIKIRKVRL